MKWIDSKGRIGGKISILDLIVILLIILMAGAFYMKRNVMEHTSVQVETQTIRYSVKIENVRDETLGVLQVGDSLFADDNKTNNPIGTIVDIQTEISKHNLPLRDGSYIATIGEGYSDVLLTVEAEGTISKGHYYVDRLYEICENSNRKVFTLYYAGTGYIAEILS